MGIVFVVTGLGLLAGGAYAVVEGWPYLLIERGFTLVIVGVVLMTAGVVMLALSRVLAELRRVRGQLSNAIMALSVASMSQEPAGQMQGSGAASDGQGGSLAIGAAVLAGGALAGGVALSRGRDAPGEPQDQGAGPDRRDEAGGDEPDLFASQHSADIGNPAESAATDASVALDMETMAHQAMADEPEPWAQPSWREAGDGADVALHSEPGPLPEVALDEFETALAAATRQEAGSQPRVEDDLDRLRDRLALATGSAGQDFDGPGSLVAERRERVETDRDAADDWLTSVSPARERWFSEPVPVEVATEPEPVHDPEPELETLPVWPPQTREAASFEADAAPPEPDHGEPVLHEVAEREPVQPEADAEVLPVFTLPTEPAPLDLDGPSDEALAEPPAPAASEEGVVGAYQVGTTYFTLYADGSIQARTPEGDYSFASMDELKTYLASERSRIGA